MVHCCGWMVTPTLKGLVGALSRDIVVRVSPPMTGRPAPKLIDPQTADTGVWKRFHELRRLRQAESRPDDPVRPDELEEQRMKRDNPFQVEHRYELSADEQMLSWLYGQTVRPGTAEYEKNKHLFWADIYVRPGHRRRGIGRSWLPLLLELVDRHGCTTVGFGTEEDSGHAFLRWLGAEAKMVGAENRLDLSQVDWDMLGRWVESGERRSPQTRLTTYDGPLPEAMWPDFSNQQTAMLNSMPFEDLDVGHIVVTPDHLREWYARMELAGDQLSTALTREPDGSISAVTEATWAPYRPALIHQMFTGVHMKERGRGLGKWVKAAMLFHLRDLHPEARWVATDNVGSNAPMLAINRQLGFKEYRVGTEYQLSRDTLAARVKRL